MHVFKHVLAPSPQVNSDARHSRVPRDLPPATRHPSEHKHQNGSCVYLLEDKPFLTFTQALSVSPGVRRIAETELWSWPRAEACPTHFPGTQDGRTSGFVVLSSSPTSVITSYGPLPLSAARGGEHFPPSGLWSPRSPTCPCEPSVRRPQPPCHFWRTSRLLPAPQSPFQLRCWAGASPRVDCQC